MALLIGVALLAGISGGILSAAVWARNTIRAQDDAAAAHVATTYAIPGDCAAGDLDVTFTSPDSISSGSSMTLNVTVNNNGSEACLLDLGGEHVGALITSGGQTVWQSTVCPFTPTSRRLLVAPGDAAAATIIWDGNVASSQCAPAATASGTATPTATDAATGEASAEATETATAEATAEGSDGAGSGEAQETQDAQDAEDAAGQSPASAAGDAASAGTYRVRIQLDGADLTEDHVFVIE
ncbi:hypothetical protein GZ998_07830 [Actinomyces sp. 594]|uniref:hypothetical protein n=1 Tax=Actinomyces sp. 594 TaxID=2057793 RepID=UPI001C5A0115|nr:hypothetical protein [Actinomyces sp. 594]MBW3069409.1 hypothetical protein [Actinomyces sp. 594]